MGNLKFRQLESDGANGELQCQNFLYFRSRGILRFVLNSYNIQRTPPFVLFLSSVLFCDITYALSYGTIRDIL